MNYGIKYTMYENDVTKSYGTGAANYLTTVLGQQMKNFVNSVPTNEPFFLVYAPFTPHAPAMPHPNDIGYYKNLANWRPSSYNESDVTDKPLWLQNTPLLTSTQIVSGDSFRKSQLEALRSVDRSIGNLWNQLRSLGRLNNTLIIFMSDNGMMWGEHRLSKSKGCVYEECVRVPL